MRQYIEVDGKKMQKRAKDKAKSYDLCANCVERNRPLFPCKRPIGMASFCETTGVSIIIYACPEFEAVEEEDEVQD